LNGGIYFLNIKPDVMTKENHIPKGYQSLTPSLSFKRTEEAIEWYKNVFGATEKMKINGPDKKIMHAELMIGNSCFFLAEENPQYGNKTPDAVNGNSITLHLYVKDVDDTVKKAVQNGATLLMAPMDMFYGDRIGNILDPYGYSWALATHVKDVSESEMKKMAQEFKQQPEHEHA
jgi:PhnB protein